MQAAPFLILAKREASSSCRITLRAVVSLTMSKSAPILFSCPCCEAEYQIISIEAPCDVPQGKIACLKCDALFPAGEGRVFFKYFLAGRPGGRPRKRK